MNSHGKVRTVISYFLMIAFVGGFVFAGSRSTSYGSSDDELLDELREQRSERSNEDGQERGREASREYSEERYAPERAREGRESRRESTARERQIEIDHPPGNASEGVRTPGGSTPDRFDKAEEIPSDSQPTTCENQQTEELCATLSFGWSKPHRSVMWYVAPDFENYKGRKLFVRPINMDEVKKKRIGRLSSIVVFYQSGESEDLIAVAKKLPRYKKNVSKNGDLFVKKEDTLDFWLRKGDPIEAIYIQADSWVNKETPVQFEFRSEKR